MIAFSAICTVASYAVLRHLPPGYTATSIVWLGGRDAGVVTEAAWSMIDGQRGNATEESRVATATLTSVPVMRRVAMDLNMGERRDDIRGRFGTLQDNLRDSAAYWASRLGLPMAVAGDDEADFTQVVSSAKSERLELPASATALDDSARALLTDEELAELGLRMAISDLVNNLSADVDMRAEIAVIEYSGTDPELAAEIVNAVPRAFRAERQERLQAGAVGAAEWLADRVDQVRRDLVESERRVQTFRAENGLDDSGESSAGDSLLNRFVSEIETARVAETEAREKLERARAALEDEDTDLTIFRSVAIERLLGQQAAKVSQRREYLSRVGPDHALVEFAEREIAGLNRDIRAEKERLITQFENEAQRATERVETATAELITMRESVVAEAEETAETSSELSELTGEATADRMLYQDLLARLKTARQVAAYDRDVIRVIQPALVPSEPAGLSANLLVAATGVGSLMFGLMFVAGLSLLDRRITGLDQLDRVGFDSVVGAPEVPVGDPSMIGASQEARRRLPSGARRARLLFDEAVRRLLALTAFGGGASACRVAMVTSGSKQEGKSTVSTALARAAAMSGASAVLVEADMRRPGHFASELENVSIGLLDVLEGNATLDEALVREEATGLTILPTIETVQGSTERLCSASAHDLFQTLRERFDFIVVDTPPVCLTPDAEVLAAYADSVVLVLSHGSSTMDRTQRAVDLLDRVYDGPVSAFLNRSKSDFLESYYGPGEQLYEVVPHRKTKKKLFGIGDRSKSRSSEHYTRLG